jgi:hypothetical protein
MWRNGETDLLGSFEIDHELEFGRLLDWKSSGLGALSKAQAQRSVQPLC